ncbi:MAG: ComF family protein [Saprospiraceae bacterium]|nr:ComF family protein [Bacteroidia bacterium]NNF20488.1 ComF family protein [Saprospiraceae bacterium]
MLSLIYPPQCISCENDAPVKDDVFCLDCKLITGYTNHFQVRNNEMNKRLSARVETLHAAALYNFIKDGAVQKAIHALKYKQRRDVASVFGRQAGKMIKQSQLFEPIDLLIPIPLHQRRKRKRGYNQSTLFAEAVCKELQTKLCDDLLIKKGKRRSQTEKGRSERFKNVLHSFRLKAPERAIGKSILLVDDVITTGATIEAAYHLLHEIPDTKIQILVIALAND